MTELSLKATDFRGSAEFDSLMRKYDPFKPLKVHLDNGIFWSAATLMWADTNDVTQNQGFRVGREWTFDSTTGATLAWDYLASVRTSVPMALLQTIEARFHERLNLHTDEEIWLLQPEGQQVNNLRFDLSFSKAVPLWREAGLMLRIGATALGGHRAVTNGCVLADWGAWGYEGFPWYIQGAHGMYDRNAISRLDPTTHIFNQGVTDSECSCIINCVAEEVDETLSNNQVTLRFIAGSVGNPIPGDELTWAQTPLAYAFQRGNRSLGKGVNKFQGHTIYNSLRGDIDNNFSQGIAVGAYGDSNKNKGLHVWNNRFLKCDYAGIHFPLSPGDPKDPPSVALARQFSHEAYDIGLNQITSKSGLQVAFDTHESELPTSDTRYIRGMKVDASLILEDRGGIGTIRTGQDKANNSGCSLLRKLRPRHVP